jgi:hypothetical protein
MPTDPSIILAGQNPQIDIGAIFGEAYKIKAMRQEQGETNALKAFFANPENLDPKTGLPTENALAGIIKVAPTKGLAIAGQVAKVEHERQLGADDVVKRNIEKDGILEKVVRAPAATAYDNAISAGQTPAEAAKTAQKVYSEGLEQVKQSGEFSADETGQFASNFDIDRIRARQKVYQAHASKMSPGEVETLTDPDTGVTYDHDKLTGTNRTLAGEPYTPSGRASKVLGGGQVRSGMAAIVQAYLNHHPDANPDEIAEVLAQAKRTEITGTADVKAGASTLAKIENTRGMVKASEGNASKEADLVLSLVDRGGGNLPAWLNKPLQDLKVKGLGSTDAAELRTALESFKNEYVKVLSTTSGVSGGVTSDSARKEAEAFINDGLTIEQIKHNISVMKKSMANRSASLDEAYDSESRRVQDGKGGPSQPAGGPKPYRAGEVATPLSKSQFDALPSGAHYRKPGDPPGSYRVKS